MEIRPKLRPLISGLTHSSVAKDSFAESMAFQVFDFFEGLFLDSTIDMRRLIT
jgi:hypothetical protein